MSNSEKKPTRAELIEEAARDLLEANAEQWERGNCYITRAYADSNNAAMIVLREALKS